MSSASESYNVIIEKYRTEFPRGTPLVCACQKGQVEDVEAMIEGARDAGMDVTAMVNEVGKDSRGNTRTPLMAAAWYEHSNIVAILLLYNADTATTDDYGDNALHNAAHTNKTTTTIVQLLLNNMKLEDINHKNRYGNITPLDYCYVNDSYDRNTPIKEQLINLIRQKGGKRASELNEDGDNNNNNRSELSGGSSSSMSRNVQDVWVISSDEEISSDSEDEDGYDNNNNNYNPKFKKAKNKSKKRKRVSSSSREQPVKITTEQDNCPICLQRILSNNCTWNNNGELVDDENQKIIIVNCCNTAYHENCYLQMLSNRNICAICQRTLIGYRNPIKTLAIKLYNLKF